jgi:hypothetical protein
VLRAAAPQARGPMGTMVPSFSCRSNRQHVLGIAARGLAL